MHETILILAAHPDDEVLGCGGALARFAAEGARIHVAFMTDGVLARPVDAAQRDSLVQARRACARAACAILGVGSVSFGDFGDNRMDSVALLDIVRVAESLIEQHRPTTVLAHHAGDLNIDHRRVHEAAAVACRPRSGHPVRRLMFFEVPSSTEWQVPGSGPAFQPNWFVDISATLDRKLQALDAYAGELRDWPHPRSRQGVAHLAAWRGATAGFEAAEAFMLGRQLA